MEASDQSPVIQDTTLPRADRGSTVGDASSSPVYEQSKPEAVGKNRDAASMDPTLTAKLRADYDALQNDVQQARELASDFQRQLAGKSNECAELKRVFGETKNHLIRLEKSITELRAERHRLASEAMRAIAWEQRVRERDAQIEQLETEVKALREQLAREKNRACKTKTDVERSSAWRALFGKKVS